MKSDRCPTCHRKHKRSHAANARYWLLLHQIADNLKPQDVQHSADTWHIYFKTRFLGSEEVQLPNGKAVQIPNSTAELAKDEFNEYMDKVEHWAGEHGVWLADLAA